MMDERYWKPNHPQRDAYRDAIAALWKRAYPGTYTPGPFGRGVKPSATADEILGLATSILPRQNIRTREYDVRRDGPYRAPIPVPLAKKGAGPSIVYRQAEKPGIGHNSGASGMPIALMAALKETAPERRGGPAPKPPGIQVAHEDSESGLITIPGLTLTGLGVDPKAVKDLGDKVDGILGDAWDAAKDAPLLGVGRYGPLGPNLRDMLGEDEKQAIDKAPPQDAPDLDTQETFPDQSDDRGFGGTLVFPDGSRYDDLTKLPPSEDQSDILPQGTILNIKDSKGNDYDWDVSGAHPKNVRNAGGNLDQISNPDLADRLKQVTAGAKLIGEKGDREYITNLAKRGGAHPEEVAGKDYYDLIRSVGGDPSQARKEESQDGSVKKIYKTKDGTKIVYRTITSRDSGEVTNEIQVNGRANGTHGETYFKIRYRGESQ
ncbi:hypothetical protein HH303_08105 [Rhodospirillaceae bacterium KN72]|uniref:Uncharacterized protein n=1 Tax=Pacificispira spongiicola TaxID=2729598 RepID=A0A7Y0HGK1_9PROT|nr:hypothetical protein [Pacificispira spongiicola]NMM44439.1 hypothetical protein [Pacificispira spongiicola]